MESLELESFERESFGRESFELVDELIKRGLAELKLEGIGEFAKAFLRKG